MFHLCSIGLAVVPNVRVPRARLLASAAGGHRRIRLDEATLEDWNLVTETLAPFSKGSRMDRLIGVIAKRRANLHIVLENVADPYNAAAIMRTAEGLGVQHIHLIESVQYGMELKVPRAEMPQPSRGALGNVSMGASRWLSVCKYKSAADCHRALRELGLMVYASDSPPLPDHDASDLRSEQALEEIDTPFTAATINELDFGEGSGTALIFGNERRGVSRAFIEHADRSFYLPVVGLTQSFNISVSVAMSLYAAISSGRFPEGSLAEAQKAELLGRWLLRDVKASRQLLKRATGLEFVDF